MSYIILAPANWILLLLLLAWLCRRTKWKKRLIIAALIVFIIFSNRELFLFTMKLWQPPPVELAKGKYETGILLGGIGYNDQGSNGYFKNAGDRFIQANKLWHLGIIKKILVSAGGRDTSLHEARFIGQQLIDAGVAPTDILLEERSTTTYENAIFCKRIIDSLKLQGPFVLITSAIHIPRATRVFREAYIPVVPFPCDYEITNTKEHWYNYVLPDVEVLAKWTATMKEWAGIAVYRMQGKI